jgi:hypothetical protein
MGLYLNGKIRGSQFIIGLLVPLRAEGRKELRYQYLQSVSESQPPVLGFVVRSCKTTETRILQVQYVF